MDGLTDQDVWTQWLVRAVVAVALVVGYHYFSQSPSHHRVVPGQTVGVGGGVCVRVKTLEQQHEEEDWKTKRLHALEERLAALEQQRVAELTSNTSQSNDNGMYESSPDDEQDYLDIDDEPKDAIQVPSIPAKEETGSELTANTEKKVDDSNEKEESEPEMTADKEMKTAEDESPTAQDDSPKDDEKKLNGDKAASNTIYDTKNRRRIGQAPKSTKKKQPPQPPPALKSPIKATVDVHPGLDQFYYWYNIETSLYRIYEIGRTDGVPVVPPYYPKSERGNVQVSLVVGSRYYSQINVFWVDYKGREVPKGRILPGSTWHQQTWIGHPWTFRSTGGELLLHYVPHRIIPTTLKVPTVDRNDPDTGIHQFVIGRPESVWSCSVHDPVLPHRPEQGLSTPVKAAEWTFQHMSRTGYLGGDLLAKYLTNIVFHPDKPKYRQIRTAHARFYQGVWNTAARGLLLACGFVEKEAYAELGTMEPLSRERVQDVSLLLFSLEQWNKEEQDVQDQPQGADGFGRAGYGRAGQMNELSF